MRLKRLDENLNVPLPAGMKRRLEERATMRGQTMSEFARAALQSALERVEAVS